MLMLVASPAAPPTHTRNGVRDAARAARTRHTLSLDQRRYHRVRLAPQDRTQRLGNREVRCDAGAVPATVTGKQPSENHSSLSSAGKADGSVDGRSHRRNPGARKPTRGVNDGVSRVNEAG